MRNRRSLSQLYFIWSGGRQWSNPARLVDRFDDAVALPDFATFPRALRPCALKRFDEHIEWEMHMRHSDTLQICNAVTALGFDREFMAESGLNVPIE